MLRVNLPRQNSGACIAHAAARRPTVPLDGGVRDTNRGECSLELLASSRGEEDQRQPWRSVKPTSNSARSDGSRVESPK